MRLHKLHLLAYGPFTDKTLDLGAGLNGLVLIHGPNEVGKSSAVNALTDLRFGIEHNSTANFVHTNPQLLVGGEFTDKEGIAHSLIRRKGRGNTLYKADFSQPDPLTNTIASPNIEKLLTDGLDRQGYLRMFGLDRERMLQGGENLFSSEGDIGSVLFEASTGTHNISGVLTHLQNSARKYYIPSGNAKNALINKALKDYREHSSALTKNEIRPQVWIDCSVHHQDAKDKLGLLENSYRDTNSELLLCTELRFALPLLSQLDNDRQLLLELIDVPVLSESAEADRRSIEIQLGNAEHQVNVTQQELSSLKAQIDSTPIDTPVLEIAATIRRAVAAVETLESLRGEVSHAKQGLTTANTKLSVAAKNIAQDRTTEALKDLIPTTSEQTEINRTLLKFEQSKNALDEHEYAGRQLFEEEVIDPGLPSEEIRAAFVAARTELNKNHSILERLTNLPRRQLAVQRTLSLTLDELGLSTESALKNIRPLMDSQIDEELSQTERLQVKIDDQLEKHHALEQSLVFEQSRRQTYLDAGAVTTPDDVFHARSLRDEQWAKIRSTLIAGNNKPSSANDTSDLPERYEITVAEADRIVDDLTSNTERATEFQQCNRAITKLTDDIRQLELTQQTLQNELKKRQLGWNRLLTDSNLPQLNATQLRDWQARLLKAREAAEVAQESDDEYTAIQDLKSRLSDELRHAITQTKLYTPNPGSALNTLTAMAEDVNQSLQLREMAIRENKGKQAERRRTLVQRGIREKELIQTLDTAEQRAFPVFKRLLLADTADSASAKARLHDFIELANCLKQQEDAASSLRTAEEALDLLTHSVSALQFAMGDTDALDPVIYCEIIDQRLSLAEENQSRYQLADQAIISAKQRLCEHQQQVELHTEELSRLCQAAGVDTARKLPELEARAKRKRESEINLDQIQRQLVKASPQYTEEQLRLHLASKDVASLDTDIENYRLALITLEQELQLAREHEEHTRTRLQEIDGSDQAALELEFMQQAVSNIGANMPAWIRSRLAHALLTDALNRFRERAQAPMLNSATRFLSLMTNDEYVGLISEDGRKQPALLARHRNGTIKTMAGLSEGTRDQLYLALRLAAVDLRRQSGIDMPLVLDDVLMSSDENRSRLALLALTEFAADNQVILLTHHQHIVDLAQQYVSSEILTTVSM